MAGRQDGTPIAEAAHRLGLSQEAVRKRLQRETLAGYKQEGHWFVLLDRQDATAGRHPDGRTDDGRTVAGRQDAGGTSPSGDIPEPIEARFRVADEPAAALVPFERVTELTAGLVERISELTARNEALALEVGQLRERTAGHEGQLAAKDETIGVQAEAIAELRRQLAEDREREREAAAELRRRALRAEAERDRLREREEATGAIYLRATGEPATRETPHAPDTIPKVPRPPEGFWWRLRRAGRG